MTLNPPSVETLSITTGPLRFNALAAGPPDGELVLLLHGFPQTSACFSSQLPALAAAGYRAVAPDQRGYSRGARPPGVSDYRLGLVVDDVLAIADQLGGGQFSVVGHDWGGFVGWQLGSQHADRIRRLTIVSTPHPRAFAAALPGVQALQSSYVAFFQVPALPEAVLGARGGTVLRTLLTSSGLPADTAEQYRSALSEPGALRAALNWYRANGPVALRTVGPCDAPTLYVWGSRDPALGRRAAEGTGRFVRGSYRFEVLEGAGHWIPELHAAQLNALVLEHLAHPGPVDARGA